MKTIIVAASIFGSSLIGGNNNSYETFNMGSKIQEVMSFENGFLPLGENDSEFVRVSFKLNEEGQVHILDMNYSDELIKNEFVKKLSEVKVSEKYKTEEVYNYSFTFKKI